VDLDVAVESVWDSDTCEPIGIWVEPACGSATGWDEKELSGTHSHRKSVTGDPEMRNLWGCQVKRELSHMSLEKPFFHSFRV